MQSSSRAVGVGVPHSMREVEGIRYLILRLVEPRLATRKAVMVLDTCGGRCTDRCWAMHSQAEAAASRAPAPAPALVASSFQVRAEAICQATPTLDGVKGLLLMRSWPLAFRCA